MKKPILIFDFDGTIADTHQRLVEISNLLSKEFNFKRIEPHEVKNLQDKTSQEVIRILKVPVHKLPAIIARAKKELHNGMSTIHPIPGVTQILNELKKINVHMGIVSSNSIDNITKFLENHNLKIFDFIHPTSKIWSKNTSLKKLIAQKGFRMEDILYIGDEIRDIVAAKKLGVKVAAVTWGYNSAQSLKKHKPHFLIEKPEDILALCQKFA